MTATQRFRSWFEYEKESHAKAIESLETVPAEARSSPEYQKAVDLLWHMALARHLWLYRFGGVAEGPKNLFREGLSLEEAATELSRIEGIWEDYLAGLSDAETEREFEYQSLEGERYRNRVEDVLTQLFGHSLYHRGQIALLVRRMGGVPAETDFIFWTRREC